MCRPWPRVDLAELSTCLLPGIVLTLFQYYVLQDIIVTRKWRRDFVTSTTLRSLPVTPKKSTTLRRLLLLIGVRSKVYFTCDSFFGVYRNQEHHHLLFALRTFQTRIITFILFLCVLFNFPSWRYNNIFVLLPSEPPSILIAESVSWSILA